MEIKIDGWDELIDRWKDTEHNHNKYFEYQSQIKKFYTLSKAVGLENIPPIRTLDISSGMGIFPFVLKKLGHSVFATNPLSSKYVKPYIDGHKVLGLPELIDFEMSEDFFVSLPESIGKFDFISAIAVVPMSFWSVELWKMFVDDCASHLNKNGRVLISPNARGRINISIAFPNIKSRISPRFEYWLFKDKDIIKKEKRMK